MWTTCDGCDNGAINGTAGQHNYTPCPQCRGTGAVMVDNEPTVLIVKDEDDYEIDLGDCPPQWQDNYPWEDESPPY